MFNTIASKVSASFKSLKTSIPFMGNKPVARLKNPTITVVYSKDSMHSIVAAAMIREHVRGNSNECRLTFIEVGEFHVRAPVSDVYMWLDMPKLNVVEKPELKKAFDAAKHLVIQGAGVGPWSTYASSRHASEMKALIETSDLNVVMCSEFTKMSRETYLNYAADVEDEAHLSALFVGLLLNSVLALESVAPCDSKTTSDTAIWSELLRLSGFEYGMLPFTSDETPLSELVGIYKFVKACESYVEGTGVELCPWLEVEDIPNGLNAAAEVSHVAARYRGDVARMREAIFKNGIRQVVTIKHGRKRKDVALMTTRIQNDFWLARRLISLTDMCYHNTRMTVTGHHTTTDAKGDIPDLYTASHKTRA